MEIMANILLTGAAGFIGWRVGERLLADGHTVLGLDNLNDYYDPRLKEYRRGRLAAHAGFAFRQADIADPRALADAIGTFRPDAVVNLAARAGVRYSMENPRVYFEANTIGTLNLLEEARRRGIRKLILSSTSSLYAGQAMPFSEDLPVNEPISPYAASKKGAEAVCYTYHYLYGIDVTVFRYFTVYGPCGRPDMSVFKFIQWIDGGQPLEIYGDGTQSRDFTYVDDVAAGTVGGLALKGFQVVNLGGNEPHSLTEMIALIETELGKKARIVHKPFHKADVKATWADIGRARALLGWTPSVGLPEGIRRTVAWHRENREWLAGVPLVA